MITRTIIDQGGRDHQEDRCNVVCTRGGWDVMLVADGHGGDTISTYIADEMPRMLLHPDSIAAFSRPNTEYAQKLLSLYRSLDDFVLKNFSQHVGSTLCTVAISDSIVIASNCGDSLAIVGSFTAGARMLSQEHKASSEIAAIEARGGKVFAPDGVMMRVNGTLNMSRAIGDGYLKRYITASPFVTRCNKRDYDYLFLASDGVWDVMTTEDVHAEVCALSSLGTSRSIIDSDVDNVLKRLLRISRQRGSLDNVVMILCIFSTEPWQKKKPLL